MGWGGVIWSLGRFGVVSLWWAGVVFRDAGSLVMG